MFAEVLVRIVRDVILRGHEHELCSIQADFMKAHNYWDFRYCVILYRSSTFSYL